MELPLQKHLPLRFAEYFDDEHFEYLCRDLWEKVDGIRRAEKHAHKGQVQRGVDIIARRHDGKISLGSCKNYKKFGKTDLNNAINEFWEHRAYWNSMGGNDLIIFIGSTKEDQKLQEAVLLSTASFANEGFDFELWDNRDLTDLLRRNPDVGQKHFDPPIVARLYGSSTEVSVSSPSVSGTNLGVAGALKERIALEFSSKVEELLPNLRKKARKGRWKAALEEIEELIASPRWEMLDPSLRSKVLVLSASLHLDAKGDVLGARTRIQLAKEADPSGRFQVVESVIALRTQGSSEALQRLECPESTDAWNVKLSILINLGRSAEVLSAIDKPLFAPNSGTYRVASLAAVVVGDFEIARAYSSQAMDGAPEEFYVRLQFASMRYLEAVLPSFKDARFLEWPIPPEWEFVLSDENALESLNAAESIFSQLLDVEGLDGEIRRALEGWKLGCLANHLARQDEASTFAAKLLAADPTHVPALVWSLERGFAFDVNASMEALRLAAQNSESREIVHVYCHLLITSGDSKGAAELLDKSRHLYPDSEAISWRHLRVQLAVALGEETLAKALIQEEPDSTARAGLAHVAARVNASRSRDSKMLIAAALEAYETTNEPRCLFEACETSLMSGDPELAAQRASELLRRLPSPASLAVSAHAALEAGHYSQTMELLESYSRLIPEGAFGNRMRRLKIECLARQGDLSNAIKHAEDLARQSPDLASQLALFHAQVHGADLHGCIKTARKLIEHPDISDVHLIQVAKGIHLSDQGLAAAALQKALEKGLSEQTLGDAISIGFRIQMDEVFGPLLEKFAAAANIENSPIRMVSSTEIQELRREQFQKAAEFFTAYRNGDAPIHFAESTVGMGAFQLLLFQDSKSEGLHRMPTLLRSGSQKLKKPKIGKGELFMDFTALLIARQAGILPMVEEEFGPISISPHSIALFRSIAESIAPTQPKIVDAMRLVLAMVNEGVINVSRPKSANRDLNVSGNTQSQPPNTEPLPNEWVCVLESTDFDSSAKGAIYFRICPDDLVAASKQRKPGMIEQPVDQSIGLQPPFGARVTLAKGVALNLALDQTLKGIARSFTLSIEAEEMDAMRNQFSDAIRSEANASLLLDLVEGVAAKVEGGIYRYVTRQEELRLPDGEPPSSAERALYDLDLAPKQGAVFVWCDDRFVNGFDHFENARIVGISEMLQVLRKRHLLSKEDYYSMISNLRSHNFRYLPINEEEVLWCIRGSMTDGRFKERSTLSILRRYTALCILDAPCLKAPVPDPNGGHAKEFRWVFDSFQAVTNAIGALWADDSIQHKARVRVCDYLLREFFWPMLAIIEIAGKPQTEQDKVYGQAAAIAVLMTRGFSLGWAVGSDPHDRKHRRAQFNDWLESRLLKPLHDVSPAVIKQLARIEADSLLSLRKGKYCEQEGMRAVVARAIFDLPSILKAEIEFDRGFCDWVGLKKGGWQVSIQGAVLDGPELWNALSKAISPEGGKVRREDGKGNLTFTRLERWSPARRVGVHGDGLPPRGRFSNDVLPIVFFERQRLKNFLFRRIDWFDLGTKERATLARRISAERVPAKRVERFLENRSQSLEWLYHRTASRLRAHENVDVEADLIPHSLDSMASHLRLSIDEFKTGNFNLDDCAKRLIADIGLARAAERLVHLPVALPATLIAKFHSQDDELQNHVLSRLERTVRHPLALIQVARLFAIVGASNPQCANRAKLLIHQALACDQSLEAWQFFEKILQWSFASLRAMERFRGASSQALMLFSWLHAGRLSDIFIRGNALLKEGADIFAIQSRAFGIDLGAWDDALWNDCMHPRFSQRCPVLLAALASIIEALPTEIGADLLLEKVGGLDSAPASDVSGALLLRDSSLMDNRWGSFLGGGMRCDFRGALSPGLRDKLQAKNPSELWPTIVEGLKIEPTNIGMWSMLALILSDLPLPAEFEERLQELLCQCDLAAISPLSRQGSQNCLRFAAYRLRFQSDGKLRQMVERVVGERLGSEPELADGMELRFEIESVASCFVELSIVANEEALTYQRFFAYLANLVRAWPTSTQVLGPPIWSWPNKWPINRQAGYWEFEMCRRAAR
jgi:tetratricopeptide (TPR) repeat protein